MKNMMCIFLSVKMSTGEDGEKNGLVKAEGRLGFHHGNLSKKPNQQKQTGVRNIHPC